MQMKMKLKQYRSRVETISCEPSGW